MIEVVFNLPQQNLIELEGEYSLPIVILSVIIACVAAFTAVAMNKRAQKNSFFHQNFWLALGAIAMGFGIWSMHFIGMAAYSLPVEMKYDRLLTFLSVIPAMLATFLAFYIANREGRTFWTYLASGVFMGLGISTMHYVGMMAMKMDVITVYNKWLFIASILAAILASFAALTIFSTLKHHMENYSIHFMTAIFMGLAVSSMHYIGMFAISFYATPDYLHVPVTTEHAVKMSFIIISVTVGMFSLVGLLFLSSMIDRYVRHRTNYYDGLTKLPNRRQFEKVLVNLSADQVLAIWHIHDMERINRENGYLFGDQVLRHISEVMMTFAPPMTELYRIEGNRFAFLKGKAGEDAEFHDAMNRIAETLQKPIEFDSKEIVIPAVCAWQAAESEVDAVNVYLDVLAVLNHTCTQYEHEIIQYDSAIHTYTFAREISSDVGRAMKEHELYLVYQPKVNGRTYQITGIETLLRWRHPTYGVLSPGVFIPILEANDRMLDVTDWVIEQTCYQISEWRREKIEFGQVAINIPGQYVTSPRLLQVLKQTLSKYKLESSILELEITETSFVRNIEEAIRAVDIFRQEGFSVALDDFGTGVSSLSYLKKMPISTLKIDKSFVDGVPKSQKDSSIIQAIIALVGSLDLSVVFEGVETEEQATFLASTCERPIIQGYYFAKPMMADELLDWRKDFQQSEIIES